MVSSLRWIGGLATLLLVALSSAGRADEPVTFVDDPKILATLEQKGFAFAGIFGVDGKDDLATLEAKSAAYKAIVGIIGADVAALRAAMKAGGRTLYEVTDGNVGRVIDMRWFTTEAARFRLVGVVNRFDRRDFAAVRGEAGCGEVRLIYRLA
jgi:hypothetical protein